MEFPFSFPLSPYNPIYTRDSRLQDEDQAFWALLLPESEMRAVERTLAQPTTRGRDESDFRQVA